MSKYFIFSKLPEVLHNRWCLGRIYPILTSKRFEEGISYLVGDNFAGSGWFYAGVTSPDWVWEIVDGPKEVAQEDMEKLL